MFGCSFLNTVTTFYTLYLCIINDNKFVQAASVMHIQWEILWLFLVLIVIHVASQVNNEVNLNNSISEKKKKKNFEFRFTFIRTIGSKNFTDYTRCIKSMRWSRYHFIGMREYKMRFLIFHVWSDHMFLLNFFFIVGKVGSFVGANTKSTANCYLWIVCIW